VIAQEFLPTPFDWRIGIFDRKPLYACQYFMAEKHWQIINRESDEDSRYGRVKTMPVELAPSSVVRTALKAANLIGDGLYGVDLKQIGRKCYVIEVNDNPTIQSGVEDSVLKDTLYQRIMEGFLQRLERRRQGFPT
jgi:glutathione synthase/RimK-type ligase-like ATP-grasp enzyme